MDQFSIDYFKTIDTKQKAYWLGFLAADAYIIDKKVCLKLAIKDECIIDKFISDLKLPQTKKYSDNTKYGRGGMAVYVEVVRKEFTKNLIDKGFKSPKAHTLRFSGLGSRELDLAFLRGYYDGDGTQGVASLCSCSLKFLEDIKKIFCLDDTNIIRDKRKKEFYNYYFGKQLFYEMINNYDQGLERKNKLNHQTNPNYVPQRKFEVSKEELTQLISKYPLTEIGKKFGVSDNAVKKRCKRLNIDLPNKGRGYWQKIKKIDTANSQP
jgi:hypothetical protein